MARVAVTVMCGRLLCAAAPVWTPQQSGVAARLRGVSAVNVRVAWASGSGGTIVRTRDGGSTWQQLTNTRERETRLPRCSDDVDRLNAMAQNRRWQEWLGALSALKPHSDRKRDSYRLHNVAVAHEAIAYEATTAEDWAARLQLASTLITQASAQNPSEKYVGESAERIGASANRYRQLAEMYRAMAASPTPTPRRTEKPAATGPAISAATGAGSPKPTTMTNQDVIDLHAAGLDDDNLIAAIGDAKTVRFDLSPAGLKVLLTAKISNRVITAMRGRTK